jgi:hypothetical protein
VAYRFNSNDFLNFADNKSLSEVGITRLGMTTADNEKFVRMWYEVIREKCVFSAKNADEVLSNDFKWVPYNKGGLFRKWYGNLDCIVNWYNDGYEIKHFGEAAGHIRSTVPNIDYYFRECLTWSKISSGSIAFRFRPQGSIFDVAGACLFSEHNDYLLGLLTSKVVMHYLTVLSPTINFEGGQLSNLHIVISDDKRLEVEHIVTANIVLSRADWDAFETSWDFTRHPLI